MPKEPSDLFLNAFSNIATISATCDCGVTIFCSYANEGNFEEGELDGLRARAIKQPKKYLEMNCSSVRVYHFGDRQFVEGCPCGALRCYEEFFWDWRHSIIEYLTHNIRKQHEVAKAAMEKIEELNEAFARR